MEVAVRLAVVEVAAALEDFAGPVGVALWASEMDRPTPWDQGVHLPHWG